MTDKQKIAKIYNREKELLLGFKILGVLPFYLKHIKLPVQIKILEIRDKLIEIKGDSKVNINDFYNTNLMKKSTPLIFDLISTALINGRFLGFVLKPFIKIKIKECSHKQIHDLYVKILELSDASFFLSYYSHMTTKDYTVLKEV